MGDDELKSMRELAEQAQQRQGLKCPRCGCTDFRVSYTRRKQGAILRRRTCRHCGRQILTHER